MPESEHWSRTPVEFVPDPNMVRTSLVVLILELKSAKSPKSPGVLLFDRLEPGKTLWDFFLKPEHDNIIPRGKMPQLIQLFLSEANFTQAYNLWLGPVLQAKGYDVRAEFLLCYALSYTFTQVRSLTVHKLYSTFMKVLRHKRPKDISAIHNPVWRTILQRTLQIRTAESDEKNWLERNDLLVSFFFFFSRKFLDRVTMPERAG